MLQFPVPFRKNKLTVSLMLKVQIRSVIIVQECFFISFKVFFFKCECELSVHRVLTVGMSTCCELGY